MRAFISSAFPYDAKNNVYLCPAGQQLVHKAVLDRGHGVRTRVYRRRGQLVLPASIAPSVARKSRPHSGDAAQTSIANARRSSSSRTPELKSDVGSGNFVAEGKRKQAWKLSGHVLVTT